LADEFCDDTFYITAPQAPHQSWYPYSFMAPEASNEPYLRNSVETIKELIDRISAHIPHDRIYLMGFSQGACLALETTARMARPFGGVIAFTGGLIGQTLDERKYKGDFQGTQIFIGTSEHDPHIPLDRVQQSKTLLENLGAHVTLQVYPGSSHTITQSEIEWVKNTIFKKEPL
jgi:phospholipase/carboxylesterase